MKLTKIEGPLHDAKWLKLDMMTNFEYLRHSILRNALHRHIPSVDESVDSEISWEFFRLRLNRLIVGAARYGKMGDVGKPQYDRISCMINRLEAYRDDLNAEHLVDVANLAELEFVEGVHRGVTASDDGGHYTQRA